MAKSGTNDTSRYLKTIEAAIDNNRKSRTVKNVKVS